jgi:aminodeoxyfutalosine deaminase
MKRQRMLIHAAQIADGDRANFSPGAIAVDRSSGRILAVGTPQQVGTLADADFRDLTGSMVIPALVNAHTHLDLTHIGPLPWSPDDGGFVHWIDIVRSRRQFVPEQIRASVLDGAGRSLAGGTGFVGDIAGVASISAVQALRESDLAGVSYLEIFGQGAKEAAALASLDDHIQTLTDVEGDGVRVGLQPHAPYSCSRRVYREAAKRGLPLSTHLAETLEEIEFVRDASGPLAELLKRLGVWDESLRPMGAHPIDHLAEVLASQPFVAVHMNYVEDHHLDQLATWPISVVYCPRASEYFGHDKTSAVRSHRYREMLDRGINVALGTDSILCLDTPDRISVLDEMRLLLHRDSVDPHTLLRMATVNGARTLGIDPKNVTFSSGASPGVVALPIDPSNRMEPLRQALSDPASVSELRFLMKPGHKTSSREIAC